MLYIRDTHGAYRVATPEEVHSSALRSLAASHRRGAKMTTPTKVAAFLQLNLAQETAEQFAALFLDSQHQILEYRVMFTGTVDMASVYPREIVRTSIELNASAAIFAHNHPSGSLVASTADRAITKKLTDALKLIDVRVLDHIIVSATGTHSMAEHGEMS